MEWAPDAMRHKNQLLAGIVPSNGHLCRVVVLDANVDADKQRLAGDHRWTVCMIDARIPHFWCDKGFLSRRPLIAMKVEISARPRRPLLTIVILLSLPRHTGFMVPIGKQPGFPIGKDG